MRLKEPSWSIVNLFYPNFSSTTSQLQLSCKEFIDSLAKCKHSKEKGKSNPAWLFRLDHNQISISIIYTMGSYFKIKTHFEYYNKIRLHYQHLLLFHKPSKERINVSWFCPLFESSFLCFSIYFWIPDSSWGNKTDIFIKWH